jgi:hypothetical protein
MVEYQAWAATGLVVGHESWSEADFGPGADPDAADHGAVQIASKMVERQKFYLRQRDGRDIEVNLTDCGLLLRDGHTATAVWVARKGAEHGFCLHVENHTTGAESRLTHNVQHIRTKVSFGRTARYGLIAATPAAIAMLLWLTVPGALDQIDLNVFVLGAAAAIVVLFVLGLIVSKLVLDYFQADDDQKAWQAVDEILARVHAPPRAQIRPHSRGA